MSNPLDLALAASVEVQVKTNIPLLFLACPYSHPDINVRIRRAIEASDMTARLMAVGYAVFSPISHGHAVHECDPAFDAVGTDAETWAVINDRVLLVSSSLLVLGIPGCMESAGVRREVGLAVRANIPVNLIRVLRDTLVVERDVDPMLWSDDEGRL